MDQELIKVMQQHNFCHCQTNNPMCLHIFDSDLTFGNFKILISGFAYNIMHMSNNTHMVQNITRPYYHVHELGPDIGNSVFGI